DVAQLGRRRLDRQPDLVVAVGLAVVLEFLADGDDLAAAYHFAPHHGRFAVDDLAADPDRYGDVLIPPDDPDGTLALPLQEAGADPAEGVLRRLDAEPAVGQLLDDCNPGAPLEFVGGVHFRVGARPAAHLRLGVPDGSGVENLRGLLRVGGRGHCQGQ